MITNTVSQSSYPAEITIENSDIINKTSVKSTTDIQTPNTDTSKTAVASKVTNTPKTNKPIVKSRKKTSLAEFALRKNMRREVLAGFKVWLHGDKFFFDDEWNRKFQEYINRKI